jgi:hypothetical protein
MNQSGKVYTTQREKWIDFGIGFGAWWIINALFFGLFLGLSDSVVAAQRNDLDPNLSAAMGYGMACLSFLPLVLNVAAMIYFAYVRRWIALGLLGAFAAALFLTVCAAVIFTIYCFVSLSNV